LVFPPPIWVLWDKNHLNHKFVLIFVKEILNEKFGSRRRCKGEKNRIKSRKIKPSGVLKKPWRFHFGVFCNLLFIVKNPALWARFFTTIGC